MRKENIPLNEVHTLCKANFAFFWVNERLFLGYSLPVWFSDWMKDTKSILCPRSEEADDVDGG